MAQRAGTKNIYLIILLALSLKKEEEDYIIPASLTARPLIRVNRLQYFYACI